MQTALHMLPTPSLSGSHPLQADEVTVQWDLDERTDRHVYLHGLFGNDTELQPRRRGDLASTSRLGELFRCDRTVGIHWSRRWNLHHGRMAVQSDHGLQDVHQTVLQQNKVTLIGHPHLEAFRWRQVLHLFDKCMQRPYGYIMMDLHPASDDRFRLFSYLTQRAGPLDVYEHLWVPHPRRMPDHLTTKSSGNAIPNPNSDWSRSR